MCRWAVYGAEHGSPPASCALYTCFVDTSSSLGHEEEMKKGHLEDPIALGGCQIFACPRQILLPPRQILLGHPPNPAGPPAQPGPAALPRAHRMRITCHQLCWRANLRARCEFAETRVSSLWPSCVCSATTSMVYR